MHCKEETDLGKFKRDGIIFRTFLTHVKFELQPWYHKFGIGTWSQQKWHRLYFLLSGKGWVPFFILMVIGTNWRWLVDPEISWIVVIVWLDLGYCPMQLEGSWDDLLYDIHSQQIHSIDDTSNLHHQMTALHWEQPWETGWKFRYNFFPWFDIKLIPNIVAIDIFNENYVGTKVWTWLPCYHWIVLGGWSSVHAFARPPSLRIHVPGNHPTASRSRMKVHITTTAIFICGLLCTATGIYAQGIEWGRMATSAMLV